MTTRIKHAGFCSGGADWPYFEIQGCNNEERLEFLQGLGHTQAACVSNAGGNYLRTLFMTATIIGRAEFHDPVHKLGKPVYEFSWHEYRDRLQEVVVALQYALKRLESDKLDWSRMDAYLAGVEQFNRQFGPEHVVQVLLCLVEVPPRLIVERPRHIDFPWSFSDLWDAYKQIHIKTMRKVVERYCLHETACVGAVEILNEPDYNWIPDESRIELAVEPHAAPMWKYITELHLPQMPESAEFNHTYYTSSGVHFGYELDPTFIGERKAQSTSVLEFPWGAKFDKYVACCADLHEHISFAAQDAASKGDREVTVVSGAVTNNNLDYLARMHRANPNTFRYVDAIGLHPYHWPRHSMHDMDFVSDKETEGWVHANPRQFADDYYKRFDFLKEITKLIEGGGPEGSYGMAGKKIWITEFGVPTKKWASANAALANYKNLFIYQRNEQVPKAISAIIWEDKWDRFFDQVPAQFLHDNHVEAILFYTMRGGGIGESTDEEHSNFTLFDLDCKTTRMEKKTFARLARHMAGITQREINLEHFEFARPARSRGFAGFGRGKQPKLPDWIQVELSPEAGRVPAMLTGEERQFLKWIARDRYEGWGAVVDLGPWVGASSVALSDGLRERGRAGTVHSLDSFRWDRSYMEGILATGLPDGADFMYLFERETADFDRWVQARRVDFSTFEWNGGPIEVLVINAAKSWKLLESILRSFGKHLEPGRSRVVVLDHAHYSAYWWPLVTGSRPDVWREADATLEGTTVSFVLERPLDDAALPERFEDSAFPLDVTERLLREAEQRASEPKRGRYLLSLLRKAMLDTDIDLARKVRKELLGMTTAIAARSDLGKAVDLTIGQLLRKGETFRDAGNFAEGRRCGEACRVVDKDHWGGRFLAASCDIKMGDFERAEPEIEALVEACPETTALFPEDQRGVLCHLQLAEFRLRRGDPASAADLAWEGLDRLKVEDRQTMGWAFNLLWQAWQSAEDPEAPLKEIERGCERFDQNADFHVLRGLVLRRAGHGDEARAEIAKALGLEPENPHATRIVREDAERSAP